jgi:hypothetical protein
MPAASSARAYAIRGASVQSDDADARDVALEQRVRRLRGRVRDERDAVRLDTGRGERALETRDDPRRDAFGRVVARRYFDARDDFARARIDDDDVRKRPTDVDADPQPVAHGVALAAGSAAATNGAPSETVRSSAPRLMRNSCGWPS